VIPQPWIERMRAAIDGALRREGPLAVNLAPRTKGAFFNDLFLWRLNEDFRAFVFESPLPRLAADILAADEVRLFYDQLFVMEPRGETGTPWHQDLPYWPIRGPDVISIWVPFDSVSPQNGVVSYVKGSHRWDKLIRPTSPRLAADGRADEMSTSGNGKDFDPPIRIWSSSRGIWSRGRVGPPRNDGSRGARQQHSGSSSARHSGPLCGTADSLRSEAGDVDSRHACTCSSAASRFASRGRVARRTISEGLAPRAGRGCKLV